jgi:hypothetical protein
MMRRKNRRNPPFGVGYKALPYGEELWATNLIYN